jgi:3-oxoacyl-[acyl-carrier protein] reductase
MKILIFGGKGGLGETLVPLLQKNHEVTALNSKECDIIQLPNVISAISTTTPDVIINMVVKNVDGFLHKQSKDTIELQVNTNITGLLNIAKASMVYFRDKGKGCFIVMSSILAIEPVKGTSVYSASKAFADSLVKTLAKENAKYGIICNSIQLGYFDGGLTNKIPQNIITDIVQSIPLQRLGRAEELANCINFIINTEYLTGANLKLAGGL